jgi:SAM-dependent methyltransferase
VEVDARAMGRYETYDEDARLWRPGLGDLVRLRSWDIFDRFLPTSGRVLDVGGGPGTHAAHLAAQGYDVTLVDPVPRHTDQARRRAGRQPAAPFDVHLGAAADLPAGDGTVDAVLLMGPLYHLVERGDRLAALTEARRVLRPGGRLLAEVITRHAWVLDAARKGLLDTPGILTDVQRSVATGLSQDPATLADEAFWAYFHQPDELRAELVDAGFVDVELVAVEGFAWLLGDLEARMANPSSLLEAVRLTESEPSMLGCSAHVIAVASRH